MTLSGSGTRPSKLQRKRSARPETEDHHPPSGPDQLSPSRSRRATIRTPSPRRLRPMPSADSLQLATDGTVDTLDFEDTPGPVRGRAPTPHPSGKEKMRQSDPPLQSRVSFDSVRSRRHRPSRAMTDVTTLEMDEPHFGAARGIGPAGEAIEVIGLGRKEPRHRKFQAGMLKPAMRGRSRRPISPGLERFGSRRSARNVDKPLPSRPSSHIQFHPSVVALFSRSRPHHVPYQESAVNAPIHRSASLRSMSRQSTQLRSLFSSFSLDPSSSSRRDILQPADDLYTYLRRVNCPTWTSRGERKLYPFGNKVKGLEAMSWAWMARAQDAEVRRMQGRSLRVWEAVGNLFEQKILECK